MTIKIRQLKFSWLLIIYLSTFTASLNVIPTPVDTNEGIKNDEIRTTTSGVPITDEKFVERRIKSLTSPLKLYGGENAGFIGSIGMVLESSQIRYLSWTYCSDALLFSDRCFVTSARCLANLATSPPTLESDVYKQVYIPRTDCQVQYPVLSIFLNDPYYNATTRANSIAIIKTKRPVFLGNECGGSPVETSWVSCSPDGPPATFLDCFATSYGEFTANQDVVPEYITPKRVPLIILSETQCNASASSTNTIPFTAQDEICASTNFGIQPVCSHDLSPVMYCKNYWKNTPPYANGGWSAPSMSNSLLAVGHWVAKNSGDYSCTGEQGASIFVKYGSPTYKDLFAKCGYQCSDSLPPGYRCDGNPPMNLGPVYCRPVKIQSGSNGWRRNSAPPPPPVNKWNV